MFLQISIAGKEKALDRLYVSSTGSLCQSWHNKTIYLPAYTVNANGANYQNIIGTFKASKYIGSNSSDDGYDNMVTPIKRVLRTELI
jgi:hypothetical protein